MQHCNQGCTDACAAPSFHFLFNASESYFISILSAMAKMRLKSVNMLSALMLDLHIVNKEIREKKNTTLLWQPVLD